MIFSNGLLAGVSLGCVCAAGISYLFSRKNISADECEPKNIKEDLEDDSDDQFVDADTGSYKSMTNENLNNVKQSKSIEVEKQIFRDLQHIFELSKLDCLATKYYMSNAIQGIQHTVDKQQITIENLKLNMSDFKTDLNRLIGSIDLLRAEMTSTERNIVKPDSCKLGRLKTRILILEREAVENSSKMIGIDHTFLALSLTRPYSGVGAAVSPAEEIRSDQNQPNAHCRQPTTPTYSSSTLAGPPPVHPVPRPPPPTPSATSGFGPPPPFPPPPPPPPSAIMTTGKPELRTEFGKKKSASELAGPEKNATKTYGRIPITVEILKSVVLKPVVRPT